MTWARVPFDLMKHPSAPSAASLRSFSNGRGQRAFTLIELLVVIAIIAVLAALIFPALSSVRRKADQSKCMNHLRQWGIAIQGFANDRDGMVVCGSNWNNVGTGTGTLGETTKFYEKYLNPGGEKIYSRPGSSTVIQATEYFRACPSQQWTSTGSGPTGYGFARPRELNASGTSDSAIKTTIDGLDNGDGNFLAYNIRNVATPSQLLQLMETTDGTPGVAKSLGSSADIEKYVKPLFTKAEVMRHGPQVNALFADGHVETFGWEDLDQDTPEEKAKLTQWFRL